MKEVPEVGYKVASVQMMQMKPCESFYCRLYNSSIKIGDIVLIDPPANRYCIGKVTEIKEANRNPYEAPLFDVVCKINYSAYKYRVDNRERMNEILRELDSILKKSNKLDIYRFIAETNEEARVLLDEYESLKEQNYE